MTKSGVMLKSWFPASNIWEITVTQFKYNTFHTHVFRCKPNCCYIKTSLCDAFPCEINQSVHILDEGRWHIIHSSVLACYQRYLKCTTYQNNRSEYQDYFITFLTTTPYIKPQGSLARYIWTNCNLDDRI
jgi:hypothetical protein